MVYVDELKVRGGWCRGATCHLLPHSRSMDDVRELHLFAQRLGVTRDAFRPGWWPHYEISRAKRSQSVESGAGETTARRYVAERRTLAPHAVGAGRPASQPPARSAIVAADPPSTTKPAAAGIHGFTGLTSREVLGIELAEHLRWLEAVTRFDQSLLPCARRPGRGSPRDK